MDSDQFYESEESVTNCTEIINLNLYKLCVITPIRLSPNYFFLKQSSFEYLGKPNYRTSCHNSVQGLVLWVFSKVS